MDIVLEVYWWKDICSRCSLIIYNNLRQIFQKKKRNTKKTLLRFSDIFIHSLWESDLHAITAAKRPMNTELTSRLAQTTAVYIFDFLYIHSHLFTRHGFIWNQHDDLLPFGLLAQRDGAEGELTDT